jgi:hypothetical protein
MIGKTLSRLWHVTIFFKITATLKNYQLGSLTGVSYNSQLNYQTFSIGIEQQ